MNSEFFELSQKLIRAGQGHALFCAESCTAGMVSSSLGAVSGASKLLWGGAVVYTADAKVRLAGVEPEILRNYGEVSEAAVEGMIQGSFNLYPVTLVLGISGIAGPLGGTSTKPVGLVYLGVGIIHHEVRNLVIEEHFFSGDRGQIQRSAVGRSLELLYSTVVKEWF